MGTPLMKSVRQAFEVIDVLWRMNGAGPTKLASAMDIHKSTAYVYLKTLESTGYVVNDGGKYRLSHQFLTTGSRIKNRSRIYHASKEGIASLADETGELATLVIEEAGTSVILHQEEGDKPLELGTYSGMAIPLHTTASGKAILAHLPDDDIDEILDDGLERVTEYTITDEDELREELEEIRTDGFAVDTDQQVIGMGIVAVPVLVDDHPKGSVALACPTGRIQSDSYRTELLHRVQETVDRITIKYRYGTQG